MSELNKPAASQRKKLVSFEHEDVIPPALSGIIDNEERGTIKSRHSGLVEQAINFVRSPSGSSSLGCSQYSRSFSGGRYPASFANISSSSLGGSQYSRSFSGGLGTQYSRSWSGGRYPMSFANPHDFEQHHSGMGLFSELFPIPASISELLDYRVAEDYDYSIPTYVNYNRPGSECVGSYADIRSELDTDYHGCYEPARQLMQDVLVESVVSCGTVHKTDPWVIFTAGAMGAGKSHVVNWIALQGHFPLPDIVQVDPDRFRMELPEWEEYVERDASTAGSLTHRESGFCVEIAQEAAMRASKMLWVDGSLRDPDWYQKVFCKIRERHPSYKIAILHVKASWENVCERAASRAELTGRVVPEAQLRESFESVPAAVEILSQFADFVAHIENNSGDPVLTQVVGKGNEILPTTWEEVNRRFAALKELRIRYTRLLDELIEVQPVVIFSKTFCPYSAKVKKMIAAITPVAYVVELDKLTRNDDSSKARARAGSESRLRAGSSGEARLNDDGSTARARAGSESRSRAGSEIRLKKRWQQGGSGVSIEMELMKRVNSQDYTTPQVFIGGDHIGGCHEVVRLHDARRLRLLIWSARYRAKRRELKIKLSAAANKLCTSCSALLPCT